MDERAKHYLNYHMSEISKYGEEVKEIVFSIMEKYSRGGVENITPKVLLQEDMKEKDAYNVLKDKIGSHNIAKFLNTIKKDIYKNTISS